MFIIQRLNIFLNAITNVECHDFQQKIVRVNNSVALDKEGCEVHQDVKLFFKNLETFKKSTSIIIALYKGLNLLPSVGDITTIQNNFLWVKAWYCVPKT